MLNLFTVFASLLALPAWASNPQFVRLQPDQASYEVGAKAIIFAYVDRLPTEDTKEFFVTVRVGGELTNAIRLSDRLLVALPNRFRSEGPQAIEWNVFLQDKAEQIQLAQSAAFYQKQIDGLAKQMIEERDPEIRARIEALIAKQEFKLREVRSRIEGQRTLVEVGHSSVSVGPAFLLRPAATFSLTADRNPAEYFVGERATFTAHLNTQFTGPDGPKEVVLRGKFGQESISLPLQFGDDFIFTSPLFSNEQLGTWIFEVTYSVRSRAQSNLLRSAIAAARERKLSIEATLGNSVVPEERAYLEEKILELDRVLTALSAQLEEILIEVDQNNLNFNVTDGEHK